MTAVYLAGVVQSAVVHTHVNTEDVGKVDRSSHTSFILADDHEMVIVDMKSLFVLKKSLNELISRLDGLKTMKRSSILYTRIMCVKSDDVLYAHSGQFLECRCTVQRFTASTFALAALIKVRHDDIDTACFAADRCNHTFQILKMVVRRHQVGESADTVSQAVVGYIYHKIDIITTDRFIDLTLTFTGAKTRSFDIDNVRIALISFKCEGLHFCVVSFVSPFNKPFIDLFAKGTTAFQRDESQSSYWKCSQFLVV